MPITQAESGLTVDQYTALSNTEILPIWNVMAHRYNLDFSLVATPAFPTDNDDRNFDAAVWDDQELLVRFVDGECQSWDLYLDNYASAEVSVASGWVNTVAPSIEVDGSDLFVFGVSATGIERISTTNLADWAGPEAVVASTAVVLIAATSSTRVHYVVFDSTTNLYNLRVADYVDSAWVITASDIWWQYPIESFDAATNSDGEDVLIMVAQIPGLIKTKYVNNVIQKAYEPAIGVIAFKYKYGTWSDHFEIEAVDNMSTCRFRRSVKINLINGTLFATVLSVNGTVNHSFSAYRNYTSKDGKYWSLGYFLPIEAGFGTRGLKLLYNGDDLIFGFQRQKVYQSYSTLMTGYSPVELQIDITPYISSYELSQDSMASAAIMLDNANGTFNDHEIINADNVIALVHSAGYQTVVDDEYEDIVVQVALTEVDTVNISNSLPERTVKLVARDRLSWMTDKRQSEESHYWESQLLGGDEYSDNTGTNYGGLSHTATQEGSWTTEYDQLNLRSSNKRGVAFSTFGAYVWNGASQATFALATKNNDEYAGIAFRAYDKDNMWFAYYNQTADKIHLVKIIAGTETIVSQTGSLGWASTPTTKRWLRVEFNYARCRVLSSIDGVNWTLQISYLMPGQGASGTIAAAVIDKGFVGFIGKGWSPEDTWSLGDFNFPDIRWEIPDIGQLELPDPGILPGYEDGLINYAIARNDSGKLARTASFTSGEPIWDNITVPNGTPMHACWDWSCELIQTDGESGSLAAYVAASDGSQCWIYHTDDINADEIEWESLSNWNPTGSVVGTMMIERSRTVANLIECHYATDYGTRLCYSTDDGDTWTDTFVYVSDAGVQENYDKPMGFDLYGQQAICTSLVDEDPEMYGLQLYSDPTTSAFISKPAEVEWPNSPIVCRLGQNDIIYAALNAMGVQDEVALSVANADFDNTGTFDLVYEDGYIDMTQTVTLDTPSKMDELTWEIYQNIEYDAGYSWSYDFNVVETVLLQDGTQFIRQGAFTTNNVDGLVWDGPLQGSAFPAGSIVASVSLHIWSLDFIDSGALKIHRANFSGHNYSYLASPVDTSSGYMIDASTPIFAEWSVLNIAHDSASFPQVIAIETAPDNPNFVAYVAYDSDWERCVIIESSDAMSTYTVHLNGQKYRNVYVSPDRHIIAFGVSRLDDLDSAFIDKRGNLESEWGSIGEITHVITL